MNYKNCTSCDKLYPISDFYYEWKSGSKTIGKCKSCLNENAKERYKLRREMEGFRVEVRSLPNTYANDQQRNEVFDFLKLIGWNFNEDKGIWFKEGLKNQDGKFINFVEKPKRFVMPIMRPDGYIHKNKGKTKLNIDEMKELYEFRCNGATWPQISYYYKISHPTAMKYFNYYYEYSKQN
jgi:hypothetical protein